MIGIHLLTCIWFAAGRVEDGWAVDAGLLEQPMADGVQGLPELRNFVGFISSKWWQNGLEFAAVRCVHGPSSSFHPSRPSASPESGLNSCCTTSQEQYPRNIFHAQVLQDPPTILESGPRPPKSLRTRSPKLSEPRTLFDPALL